MYNKYNWEKLPPSLAATIYETIEKFSAIILKACDQYSSMQWRIYEGGEGA